MSFEPVIEQTCVDSIESCNEELSIIRPGNDALRNLDAIYFLNILMIPFGRRLLDLTADIYPGPNSLFITLQVEHIVIWLPAAVSLLLYLATDNGTLRGY